MGTKNPTPTEETDTKKIIVEQIRSIAGREKHIRATLRALGLGSIGRKRELPNNPSVRGMIRKVQHLIQVH